ncbi:peptidylprolyl isomerase [Helicobacter turcicus]|uniref:Peptidylprolyl isomerase n=1 Tax=Helicobacter turcicus TaxID=2867412 RepID=A0ABS7JMZ4_9HELI|nr:peptidylprolyl isomerase [Helicobacter turcicus]MBX7490771.1 peptidylprolyl isomerase [Helicobacter turcicus]MBX7545620.1 peptidylprolyl isomerase [Helicobacter turcicus]
MIGFMQKHKKYLIITIWISSIAFLGAGFVGWGTYSFSSTSNAAAIVGNRQITIDRLQREYARLYNVYNQLFNGTLDNEQAKKLGIEEQALNTLISRALMLNYAHDMGLRVSKEEIIHTLTTMDAFQNNGKFDEIIYKRLLADNQMRPKDFEEELSEGILLQKLDALLEIPLTPLEIQAIGEAVFSEDHLRIQILNQSTITFNPTEEEIRKYWEENKDIYQTERGYEVLKVSVNSDSILTDDEALRKHYEDFKNQFLDENGQLLPFEKAKDKVTAHYKSSQAEKESLKEYISLRKGENKKAESLVIYEGDSNYDTEFLNLLSQAKEQETLKPIKTKEGFITLKVQKIIPSEPKSYEDAKKDATEDFTALRKTQLLEEKATALLADFKGIDIGYVSRENEKALNGLNMQESQDFIAQLFRKNEAKGYILLKDKVILYEILDQRLKNSDIITQNLDFLKRNGEQVKSRLVEIAFMEHLLNLYKIVRKI